jgi:feruloyl esterase
MLNNAVLAACVGKDGGLATDSFLTDPRDCHFDPASLQCTSGDAPTCLTAQQVDTAKKFYDGPRNPRTHALIYPGWPLGTELGWAFLEDPALFGLPAAPAFEGITTWALGLHYNPLTVDFDSDMAKVDAVLAPTVNFMSTDLTRFSERGGKFILYHGFADAIVSAQDTINYYDRIRDEQNVTRDAEESFIRLFLVPGMGHSAAQSAVPQLIEALEDEFLYVRIFAAGALGSIGPKAQSAREALRAAADDPALRDEAEWALSRIAGIKSAEPARRTSCPRLPARLRSRRQSPDGQSSG